MDFLSQEKVHSLLDLQILDLSRNSIRRIPEEIRNMRALRVFSVTNNKIEDVPFVVGFLESLQIIRLSNNPLNNGLKGILNSNDISTSDVPTPVAENEKETWLTRKIKTFLKSEAMSLESGGESRFVLTRQQVRLDVLTSVVKVKVL